MPVFATAALAEHVEPRQISTAGAAPARGRPRHINRHVTPLSSPLVGKRNEMTAACQSRWVTDEPQATNALVGGAGMGGDVRHRASASHDLSEVDHRFSNMSALPASLSATTPPAQQHHRADPQRGQLKAPVELTIDDIGTPLHAVDFCIVDLETTGGRAADLGITEIGAVKVRGGIVKGEFQTLINPGTPIPAAIALLTGISDADVASAPRLPAVLPAFLEFSRGCVLVAHNAAYDMGYLKAAADALGYPWEPLAVVDTVRVSRATLGKDDVPNHKLSTLARYFRADTTPVHRALDDARATVDVLHGLLGRLGSLGVTTLEDLLGHSRRVPESQRRKRHLADGLPSEPGVYIFEDAQGKPLYVGTSRNIRTRVKSYFTSSEQRSRMAEMVNLAERVNSLVCATPLEAAVRELRLIAAHKPPYNRKSRFPERGRWLKLTAEAAPRLSLVRQPSTSGEADATYLGPMTKRTADEITEVFQAAFGIRTCTHRISPSRPTAACSLAEMGRCCAPCTSADRIREYHELSASPARIAMSTGGATVVAKTLARIKHLSGLMRYEEAAHTLSALRTYIRVADRCQQRQALSDAGEVVAALHVDQRWQVHVIRHGCLAGAVNSSPGCSLQEAADAAIGTAAAVDPPQGPGSAGLPEETDLLLRWLNEPGIRLLRVHKPWSIPLHSVGAFRTLNSLTHQ